MNLTMNGAASAVFTHDHFGGNILAYRDKVGPDGTFDEAADRLGLSDLRYPGGSLTEYYFDIENPTAATAVNSDTGEVRDFLPFDEFMHYAEGEGMGVHIVLPTRHSLSNATDANGDRYAAIDEPALRTFLRDTLDGKYGEAKIESFHIGNEYWHSGGMSSVEYGRVASEMARIVDEEVTHHPLYEEDFRDTKVIVQIGQNWGEARLTDIYSPEGTGADQLAALSEDYGVDLPEETYLYDGGAVNWPAVANALVLKGFDTGPEKAAVDAVDLHLYTYGPEPGEMRYFDYGILEKTGWDETFGPGLERTVSEWNRMYQSRQLDAEKDYGLPAAQEMLQIAESFTEAGVTSAQVWPVQENTLNDLAGREGDGTLTVQGHMFRLMSEHLPGLKAIDVSDGDGTEREYEGRSGEQIHLFAGPESVVMFMTAPAEGARVDLDAGNLMESYGSVSVTKLGVAEGERPGGSSSLPEVQQIKPASVIDGTDISVKLGAFEIVVFDFADAELTEELAQVVEAARSEEPVSDGEVYAPGPIGDIPEKAVEDGPPEEEDEEINDGGMACFVATAAFRDAAHPDVCALRRFRDCHLRRHAAGRAFIGAYWVVGPRLARVVGPNEALSRLCRRGLSHFVRVLERRGLC